MNRYLHNIDELDKLRKEFANGAESDASSSQLSQALAILSKIRNEKHIVQASANKSIINQDDRPAVLISNNTVVMTGGGFDDWVGYHLPQIAHVIEATGRVGVGNSQDAVNFLGTAFHVGMGLVVTNYHVAKTFCTRYKDGAFGFTAEASPFVDFYNPKSGNVERFSFVGVVFLGSDADPNSNMDLAFLRIDSESANALSNGSLQDFTPGPYQAAVVGFPLRPGKGDTWLHFNRIFPELHGKYLSPGVAFLRSQPYEIVRHDCSTAVGTSGGPLIDASTGGIIGIHFLGIGHTNYAISSDVIKFMIEQLHDDNGV